MLTSTYKIHVPFFSCLAMLFISLNCTQPILRTEQDAHAQRSVYAKTELLTATLRSAALATYYQNLQSGKLGLNKKSMYGLSVHIARVINDSLALYNSYCKNDILGSKYGQQLYQWTSLMWTLQDLSSALIHGKNLFSTHNTRYKGYNIDDDFDYNGMTDENSPKSNNPELTEFASKLVYYILPAAEGIASFVRAYDSYRIQNRESRLRLLNYFCFVTISGCRTISDLLESKNNSWEQVLAISRAVICATVVLVDLVKVVILDELPKRLAEEHTHAKDEIAAAQKKIAIEKEAARAQIAAANEKTRIAEADKQKAFAVGGMVWLDSHDLGLVKPQAGVVWGEWSPEKLKARKAELTHEEKMAYDSVVKCFQDKWNAMSPDKLFTAYSTPLNAFLNTNQAKLRTFIEAPTVTSAEEQEAYTDLKRIIQAKIGPTE